MNGTLTERQQFVFNIIRDHIEKHKYPPTVRGIMDKSGIKSPNGIMCHLMALEKKGAITRDKHRARGIQIVESRDERRETALDSRLSSLDSRLFSENEIREACNASCACGGMGPNDPGVCPACMVWHQLFHPERVENPKIKD